MKIRISSVLLVFLISFSTAFAAASTNGLVGYWNFDEGSGAATADTSGNGNNGAISNNPTWIAGKINNALLFDNGSQNVNVGTAPMFNTTGDMTAAAWVYHNTSAGPDEILGKGYCYGSSCPFGIRVFGGGGVCFDQGDGTSAQDSVCTSSGVVPLGQWSHVVAVRSGTQRSIYVNGTLLTSSSVQTKTPTANSSPLLIGNYFSSVTDFFDGRIDEVRLYSRALSVQEIIDVMNDAGSSISLPGDTTPPIISNTSSSAVSQSEVTITWSTNEGGDTQVEYGITTNYGSVSSLNSSLVTSHSSSITGLSASTLYHYRVKSRDAAGNISVSTDQTVTTATTPPADTTAPTVPGTPSLSVISSSQINLTWTVSTDAVGVTGYRIYREGVQVGTSGTPTYSDTGLTASTNYSYTVIAYDAAGNTSAQSSSASATTQAGAPPSNANVSLNTWTKLVPKGPPPMILGYDKTEYVSSKALHCIWGAYHEAIGSEPNQGLACYSYKENRWNIMQNNGMWHSAHVGGAGHGNGVMAYMPDKDAIVYETDGSISLVYEQMFSHLYWFDVGGLSGQDKQTTLRPWISGALTPNGAGTYDPVNHKFVITPAFSSAGVTYPAGVYDPNTNTWTLPNPSGTYPSTNPPIDNLSMVFNPDNNLIYVYGGLDPAVYTYNVATNVWAKLTTTCSGASCAGNNPPARRAAGFAYSTQDHVFLMVGGVGSALGTGTGYTDTWTFNPTTRVWTQLSPLANYPNNNLSTTWDRLTYDQDSNAFVLMTMGGNGNYADGTWTFYQAATWAFALSNPLSYGRVSNSYTPTAGSLNRVAPSAGNQSWAFDPSITASGSTVYAGWIESGGYFDNSACGAGHHPFIQSTASGGSWNLMPGGTFTSACLNIDPEPTTYPGGTDDSKLHLAVVNGTLWETHEKVGTSLPSSAWTKYWNGTNWVGGQVGCFFAPCVAGGYYHQYPAALIANGNTPVIAVVEENHIPAVRDGYLYVAQHNGSSWIAMGGKLNVNGAGSKVIAAALATDGTNPASCWSEEVNNSRSSGLLTPQIYCAQWNGSSWVRWGNSPLSNASNWAYDPSLTYANGKFYVSWTERTTTGNPQVSVCRWDGSSCTSLGSSLNIGGSSGWAAHASLGTDGTNVYVGWEEQLALNQKSQVYVKKWNGSSWSQLGGSLNADPVNGSSEGTTLSVSNGQPVVIWAEMTYGTLRQTYAKQWNGGGWVSVSGTTPAPPTGDTTPPTTPGTPSLTVISSSQINLTWTTSTDAVGVTGYKIYRGGTQIGTSATNSYQNTGLAESTSYSYSVSAYDVAGNISSQSTSASATTQSSTQPLVTPTPGNTITVTNSGATTTNYPVQIGRPFVQGEIPSGKLPQAVVNGTAVPTQVDVKTRWSDGSLKHAIISFLVPSLGVGTTANVAFGSGTTVGNTPLSQAQMLASGFNFNAQIQLTKGGVTKTADARTMLTNGDYTLWTSGPIVTTVLIANDSQTTTCGGKAASVYDIGFDSFCAFRPRFEAQFWAGTNQVKVRYIGEIANTEQYEDVVVNNLVLTIGNTAPATVYTLPSGKSPLNMFAGSRWTKAYWLGGTPSTIGINNNVSYLAASGAIPNFDSSKTISSSVISSAYSQWGSKSKDLYDLGEWAYGLGDPGGHDYIGSFPTWAARWIYTGDYRMQEETLGNSDLAAAYPVHIREGNTAKFIDRAKTVSGVGRILSVSTRPSFALLRSTGNVFGGQTANADTFTAVGTVTNGSGWAPDVAHQPSFLPQYLLTGDHFYLDELQFWAGYTSSVYTAGDTQPVSRGPTGAEGGIPDRGNQVVQLRGQGWAIRGRAETTWATPDGTPEKAYFTLLTQDAICYWEGQRNITSTPCNGNSQWTFGYNSAFTINPSSSRYWGAYNSYGANIYVGMPPLHWWDLGNDGLCDDRVNDLTVVYNCTTPWMQDYLIYGLGRAKELGFATDALLTWVAPNIIGQVTDSSYNPYLVTSYRVGTVKKTGTALFSNWADVKTSFLSSIQNETDFYPGTIFSFAQNDPDGNVQPAAAAISMVAGEAGGQQAWNWVLSKIYPAISGDLKWAILPRTVSTVPPPVSIPTINSFSASPSSIISGGSATLNFSVSNATSLSIDQGVGSVTGLNSKTVSPSANTTYTLTATNGTGTVTAQTVVTVTAVVQDITAPVISSITSSGVTTSAALVAWSTNELADTQIDYGTTAAYGQTTTLNTTLSLTHSVSLASLSPSTLYHYRVRSKDASGNIAVSGDNIFTTSVSVVLDIIPPSAISNLSSSAITPSSALLSFTSPGNDGAAGTAASYDIRYSTSPINSANFSSARTVTGEPVPFLSGTLQTYTLVGLNSATTYYVSMVTSDASGNTSSLSNILSFTTSATPVTPPVTVPSTTPGTGSGVSGSTPQSIEITNFSIAPLDSQVVLSWTNPTDASFVRVLIVRKEGGTPSSSTDGTHIYEGTGNHFTDTNLVNSKTYYYRAFPVLTSGVLETGVVSTLSAVPKAGTNQVNVTQSVATTTTTSTVTTSPYVKNLVPLTTILAREITNASQTLSLQSILYLQNYLSVPSINGVYSSLTETAVKNYQCDKKIVCSGNAATTGWGNVGPTTRKMLNVEIAKYTGGAVPAQTTLSSTYVFSRNLSMGMKGEDARQLQIFLNTHGFPVALSGAGSRNNETTLFGRATQNALIRYQKAKGIVPAVGFFGPLTRGVVGR